IALANRHDVDLAIAVIPSKATAALAERIADEPHVVVLQHGFYHRNFQRKEIGEKAAELGTRRDPDEAVADLAAGAARLRDLFGDKLLPVLVPPWNRIAPAVARRLCEVGLTGLSTFTWMYPCERRQLQAHFDIIKWHGDRRFIGWRSAALRFDLQLARRRTNPAEPIGVLSHHLAHDDACFEFLARFFDIARRHPGARFPRIAELARSCSALR